MSAEIWYIIWFCLTLTNAECARLDGKFHGYELGEPWNFPSEGQCMSAAEFHADRWWNRKRFKVEYGCRKVKVENYEPFVPTRRF